MRLLSYISLRSHGRDVKVGYPLGLQIDDFEVRESECSEDFMKHIIPTLEWETLQKCADVVGIQGLPAVYSAALLEDSDFLSFVHNLLLDIHVTKGTLTCPDTGRIYPIADGIPNMMLVKFSYFINLHSHLNHLLPDTNYDLLLTTYYPRTEYQNWRQRNVKIMEYLPL